ncbi:hypothetical protein PM082_024646 [Marasmius tenuissimus]|nr:hypothetical protein PM082_024646 [Marasmius tenuissimus]
MPTEISIRVHPSAEECQCPVAGCDLAVDLILRSSDRKNLGTHAKNMEVYNSAFPVVGSVKHQIEDVVELTESEDTLKLLILYSHNCEHEDLRHLQAQKLVAFARASEKYGNFFALDACKIAMRTREVGPSSATSAIHVVIFQAAHSMYDGIDRLAGLTMELQPRNVWVVTRRVDPKLFYVWSQYRDDWRAAQTRYAAALNKPCRTTELEKKQLSIIRPMSQKVATRSDIALVDAAIEVAQKVHPKSDGQKFLDDLDMFAWYSGLKQAINGFPQWEKISQSEASLADGGELM